MFFDLPKPPDHTWLSEKKGMFLGVQKTTGGSLGTSHLAFREKGGVFLPPKTTGGSLGTSHLAFKGTSQGEFWETTLLTLTRPEIEGVPLIWV